MSPARTPRPEGRVKARTAGWAGLRRDQRPPTARPNRTPILSLTGHASCRAAACARALALGTRSYSSVAAILKNRKEGKASEQQPSLLHENIRGSDYYH